ncbi:MAG: hypothetical protein ACTSQP_20135 [Promethearchaeota archaeon]
MGTACLRIVPCTSQPRSNSCSAKWLPAKPLIPVIRTLFSAQKDLFGLVDFLSSNSFKYSSSL